jgi:protein arginine kinase
MTEKNKTASFLSQRLPWKDNANPIWLASTLKFYRNISKHLFPGKLEPSRQKQLAAILSKGTQDSAFLQQPILIKAEEIGPIEKEFLFEHFLAHDGFHQAHVGEGFAIDSTGEFLGIFNIDDHLQLQLTDCKGEIENTWNRLVKIETEIGKMVDYAFSSRFGFLTSNPNHCGTGLSAFLYLNVPALIHTEKLLPFLEKNKEEGVEATGMQGSTQEFVGDLLTLGNTYSLGLSEEDIIRTLRTLATKIISEEKSLRLHIKDEKHPLLKNKVSRAYGLACHSYQLETVEALNALSLCKLAIDTGWLTGINHQTLNELLFDCRRAHLTRLSGTKINPEDIPTKRAELIHQAFKSTTLHI